MKEETVESLKKEIRRLKKLAYNDELTGLLNRHGFKKEAGKFLREINSERGAGKKRKNILVKSFAVIIFDADFFKKINDTYGHIAGDKILKAFAEILTDRVRSIDVVARWGGEEVVVGLVGASEKDAGEVAENIRKRVESVFISHGNNQIKFTVSAGVAATNEIVDFDTLLNEADRALYKAKRTGRNKVIKFSNLQK